MNQPNPPLQSHDPSLLEAARPVLAPASVLLVLFWLAAWALRFGPVITSAASLVVAALALAVIGARYMVGRDQLDTGAPAWPSKGQATVSRPSQGRAAPIQADLIPRFDGKHWSLDVFAHIDAQRFAAVCETWFSWAGFDTRAQSLRTDEGVDIWLHAPKTPGPVAIVRCRHGLDRPVGVKEMRDFHGVVTSSKTAHGTFTTTSTYTPEALQFARDNGIDAVDGAGLLRKIKTRTRQSQQALLAVAYNGH